MSTPRVKPTRAMVPAAVRDALRAIMLAGELPGERDGMSAMESQIITITDLEKEHGAGATKWQCAHRRLYSELQRARKAGVL